MKLIDAYNVEGLYNKLSGRIDLPIKTVYKLSKFFDTIKKDADFYREKLAEILNEYAQRDEENKVIITEDGKSIKIKEDSISECEQKLKDLADIEVDAPQIKFSLYELPDGISVQELSLLMPFIKEEE